VDTHCRNMADLL